MNPTGDKRLNHTPLDEQRGGIATTAIGRPEIRNASAALVVPLFCFAERGCS